VLTLLYCVATLLSFTVAAVDASSSLREQLCVAGRTKQQRDFCLMGFLFFAILCVFTVFSSAGITPIWTDLNFLDHGKTFASDCATSLVIQ